MKNFFDLKVQSVARNATAAWFDLQGRKLDSKPTKKGVYIHEGRKVVIK